ncbi:zinc finger domain-containing protein [Staphylococcus aureus]
MCIGKCGEKCERCWNYSEDLGAVDK